MRRERLEGFGASGALALDLVLDLALTLIFRDLPDVYHSVMTFGIVLIATQPAVSHCEIEGK